MIRGIIFDLDGTILHTLPDIAWSMNKVLTEENLPNHSVEEYSLMLGSGATKLVEAALPHKLREQNRIRRLVTSFTKVYQENLVKQSDFYSGIPDVLDLCRERELKLALFSNKPHPLCKILAERFLSKWNFDIILGANNGFPRKPAPHGALFIAYAWKLHSSDLLFIGDSQADIQCARNSDIKSLAVTWGYRKPEGLMKENPDFMVNTPEELKSFISKSE